MKKIKHTKKEKRMKNKESAKFNIGNIVFEGNMRFVPHRKSFRNGRLREDGCMSLDKFLINHSNPIELFCYHNRYFDPAKVLTKWRR
jgi:hypothetical protein